MLAPDIAQLFESSYRVSVGTSLMSIDPIEPAVFAGQPGFRFAYSFVVQGEEVRRKGEATGAVIGGKLYLITFEAPVIHYFDTQRWRAIASLLPAPRSERSSAESRRGQATPSLGVVVLVLRHAAGAANAVGKPPAEVKLSGSRPPSPRSTASLRASTTCSTSLRLSLSALWRAVGMRISIGPRAFLSV